MTWHPGSESGRLSAAELYESARAEQALVLSIGGPTAPWEECAVAFQSSYPGIEVAIDGGFSNVLTPKIDKQISEGKLGVDVAVLQTLQDFARWKMAGQLLRFVPEGWETIDATFKDPDAEWAPLYSKTRLMRTRPSYSSPGSWRRSSRRSSPDGLCGPTSRHRRDKSRSSDT